jgi:hypothetical protein
MTKIGTKLFPRLRSEKVAPAAQHARRLSGFVLDSYCTILFILPARAKLFSEDWLILSENGLSMLLSFSFDQTDRFGGRRQP